MKDPLAFWLHNSSFAKLTHENLRLGLREAAERIEATAAEKATALKELSDLYHAYVRLLEAGRNRIIELGGDCDPVDRMESGDPALIQARAAITVKQNVHRPLPVAI